jgi:hypothetical protein
MRDGKRNHGLEERGEGAQQCRPACAR